MVGACRVYPRARRVKTTNAPLSQPDGRFAQAKRPAIQDASLGGSSTSVHGTGLKETSAGFRFFDSHLRAGTNLVRAADRNRVAGLKVAEDFDEGT